MVDGHNVVDAEGLEDLNQLRLTVSLTTGSRLDDVDSVQRGHARNMLQNSGSTVRNIIPGSTIVRAHLPLSNQVVSIPVAQMCSSGNHTLGTNRIVVNRGDNTDSVINIHIVRSTLHLATLGSGHHNREDVRIVLSINVVDCQPRIIHSNRNRSINEKGHITVVDIFICITPPATNRDGVITRLESIIVKSPLVSVIHRTNSIVDKSIQLNTISMTDERITSDSHRRVHHNVLGQSVGISQSTRIVGVLSGGPEGVSAVVVEVNHEGVTVSESHFEAVHIPSIFNCAEVIRIGVRISDPNGGLVGSADGGRIDVQRDSLRLRVERDRHIVGSVRVAGDILIDNRNCILITLNLIGGNIVSVHIIDGSGGLNSTRGGLFTQPHILILSLITDLIDNSRKRSAIALTDLVGSSNIHIRNRSNEERMNRSNDGSATRSADNLNSKLVS